MLSHLVGTSCLVNLGRVDMFQTSKCRFVCSPSKKVDTAFGRRRRPGKLLLSGLQLHWCPRLRSGLRRLKRRHGLTRRGSNRPWRSS
jgi:hypothetical protein